MHRLFRLLGRLSAPSPGNSRPRFRPGLEPLEQRTVLTGPAAGNTLQTLLHTPGYLAPDSLTQEAITLATQKQKYKPDPGTKCNVFLQNFARGVLGQSLPELAGQANAEYDHLTTSGCWLPLGFASDPAGASREAVQLADLGYFVVAAYRNRKGSGHVAVVVPSAGLSPSGGKWHQIPLPFVAQAGPEMHGGPDYPGLPRKYEGKWVVADLEMTWAFAGRKRPNMEIFVLVAPPPRPPSTTVTTPYSDLTLVNDESAPKATLPQTFTPPPAQPTPAPIPLPPPIPIVPPTPPPWGGPPPVTPVPLPGGSNPRPPAPVSPAPI
jgi:hypothetical protein